MRSLLKHLLQFSPDKRMTATELQRLDLFNEIRVPDNDQKSTPQTLKLDIDFDPSPTDEAAKMVAYQYKIINEAKKLRQ